MNQDNQTLQDKITDRLKITKGIIYSKSKRSAKNIEYLTTLENDVNDIMQLIEADKAEAVISSREDELELAVQQFIHNTNRNPYNFSEYATNRLAELRSNSEKTE